jgi:hypothetical protein
LSYLAGFLTSYGEVYISHWINPPPDDPQAAVPPGLSLIFKIGPLATPDEFPGGLRWCNNLDEMQVFRSYVQGSAWFDSWAHSPAAAVTLEYQDQDAWCQFSLDHAKASEPPHPVVSMTEQEWLQSNDVPLMLRWLGHEWRGEQADLQRLLQRYALACCRRIWRLLPHNGSRAGVEVAERFLEGLATREEVNWAEWSSEGAAFSFEYDPHPEIIVTWCDEVARIPPEELAALIHSPRPKDDLSPLSLLIHAAYFAHNAMWYPTVESIAGHAIFLPAPLLREIFGNAFRSAVPRPSE